MKEQIIRRIDSMIGYLQMVKEQVANGTTEQSDSLDILSLVSLLLDGTYKDIKEYFKLKEAA